MTLEKDPLTGRFDLPSIAVIVDELFARQGNLLKLLEDFAGDLAPNQKQLLFEILYELKKDPDQEKKWTTLLDLQQQQHAIMCEANFLKEISKPTTIETKPEKILAILERLAPERWAKKASTGRPSSKKNEFEELLK